ncbi:MAG: glycosyltransferase family 2 protein, partial [Pseudomonadota bacterium]
MSDTTFILRRTLTTRRVARHPVGKGSYRIAGAFRQPGSDNTVRVYLREPEPDQSPPPDPVPAAAPGALWSRVISGALVLHLSSEADGRFRLPVKGAPLIAPELVENELFDGRNVLLGTSNGEDVSVWRDWILWHMRHHQANGVLIFDRGRPDAIDARAAALKALCDADPEVASRLASVRIVIAGFDEPLGRPDQSAETHPHYAPDAHGKDRMEPAEPDPWHAPLSFHLLYDLLRQRFLMAAQSVIRLNVHDLVRPVTDGPGLFEAALQSESGAVLVSGVRAYPWTLPTAAEPTFGDHICTRFDDATRENRWCVAPARLQVDAIWMPTRILGLGRYDTGFHLWRFMGLPYCRPGRAGVGQIVPKNSLVESTDLLNLARTLGANPGRQPSETRSGAGLVAATPVKGNGVTLVTTMKNEGPFILEWIAYHRAIGARNFLIYTNDCTDGTDHLLQVLDRKGICQWRDNPYRSVKLKPQFAALNAAVEENCVRRAEWLICMDVDEYIAVHTGDGTLPALFDAVPDANLISLTWRLFGNDDIHRFDDGLVTQQFTKVAREHANTPYAAWGFKTLFRNSGHFRKFGVHRPKGLVPSAIDQINWVNGSGRNMPKDQWRAAWRSTERTYGYDLVSLNHYAVRSAESFLVKRD